MIHIITNYYTDSSPSRQKEINTCMIHNLTNRHIDMVTVLLNEKDVESLQSMLFKISNSLFDKITLVIGNGRPTYNDFFKVCYGKGDSNTVHILLNSDIYLDVETTGLFDTITTGTVWALSRWDHLHSGKLALFNRRDSQDVWAWRGRIGRIDGADFNIGVPGCDNRIARLFIDAGLVVQNPSMTVKCIHLHQSQKRNYDRSQTVHPPYYFIQPHELKEVVA